MNKVSPMDDAFYTALRDNVRDFMSRCAQRHDREGALLLDVAPQEHEGAAPYFEKSHIETLDIDPDSGARYIADICSSNESNIPAERFDFVVCTEVLEHTLQPFEAVREIRRVLRPGGLVFVSTPFNFRIHGPLPDCWRFTEHGLRALFANFKLLELRELGTADRWLMPIHYTLVAEKC